MRGDSCLTGLIVALVCLLVLASRIILDRFLHGLDGSAEEIRVAHLSHGIRLSKWVRVSRIVNLGLEVVFLGWDPAMAGVGRRAVV